MYRHTARTPALTILIAGLSIGVPAGFAATQVIGVAMSEGSILVNDARTPGNATILDGSVLQTESSASQVHFKDGSQLRLDADSRARLYTDHVDLQRGSVKISDYAAKANGLSVKAGDGSSANVTVKGKVIEVAALTGSVHVFNATGLNVANLLPGRALDLTPQDAGLRTAGFVVLATVMRPTGGVLADRIGGRTILKWVFPFTGVMAIFMACPFFSGVSAASAQPVAG